MKEIMKHQAPYNFKDARVTKQQRTIPDSETSFKFQQILLASIMCRKSVRMPASAFSSDMSAPNDFR